MTDISNRSPNTLLDPTFRAKIDEIHAEIGRENLPLLTVIPRLMRAWFRNKPIDDYITPADMKDHALAVTPEQGQFLYLTARAINAKRIVEYGSSFGISTIYLAAAIRDNGGETVIGTEIEPSKHAKAVAYLKRVGLSDFVDMRLGDAMETLQTEVPEQLDMVFLDGWATLYLPVLNLLRPHLRPGAVILGDNIFVLRRDLKPYVEYMQSGDHGFYSTTLPMRDGTEYSVYMG